MNNVYSIAHRVVRSDSRLRERTRDKDYFRFHCLVVGVALISAAIGFLVGIGLGR